MGEKQYERAPHDYSGSLPDFEKQGWTGLFNAAV
jgi:hypothetical protein